MIVATTLRAWLCQVSPLPEFVILLGVSVAIGLAARALMLRRESFTRTSANILAAVAVLVSVPLLAVIWTSGVLTPDVGAASFTKAAWSEQPWARDRMSQTLISDRVLDGMTKQQVVALLGESDGSGSGDDAWILRRPQDAFNPFPPELAVFYDEDGRVTRYVIELGFWEAVVLGRGAV